MKVFDLNGNVINNGDWLYFEHLKAIVRVTGIQEPGKIDESMPGFIALELRIPFRLEKGQKDVRFGDFIVTLNPGESARVDSLTQDIVNPKDGKQVRVLDRRQ